MGLLDQYRRKVRFEMFFIRFPSRQGASWSIKPLHLPNLSHLHQKSSINSKRSFSNAAYPRGPFILPVRNPSSS